MVTTLEELRAAKAKRKEALERELESIANQLVSMGALRLILFGSFSQGKVRRDSDLDIIAVMPASRTGREWMREIYAKVERGVDCDILAYTEEELQQTQRVSRFLRHALATGRIIHGT